MSRFPSLLRPIDTGTSFLSILPLASTSTHHHSKVSSGSHRRWRLHGSIPRGQVQVASPIRWSVPLFNIKPVFHYTAKLIEPIGHPWGSISCPRLHNNTEPLIWNSVGYTQHIKVISSVISNERESGTSTTAAGPLSSTAYQFYPRAFLCEWSHHFYSRTYLWL